MPCEIGVDDYMRQMCGEEKEDGQEEQEEEEEDDDDEDGAWPVRQGFTRVHTKLTRPTQPTYLAA